MLLTRFLPVLGLFALVSCSQEDKKEPQKQIQQIQSAGNAKGTYAAPDGSGVLKFSDGVVNMGGMNLNYTLDKDTNTVYVAGSPLGNFNSSYDIFFLNGHACKKVQ